MLRFKVPFFAFSTISFIFFLLLVFNLLDKLKFISVISFLLTSCLLFSGNLNLVSCSFLLFSSFVSKSVSLENFNSSGTQEFSFTFSISTILIKSIFDKLKIGI